MGVAAAITPDKHVIKTNKYTNLKLNTGGFLQSFIIGETTMVFCELDDFRAFTVKGSPINVEGYYPSEKYEDYLNKKLTIADLVTKYNYFNKLVFAETGDIVTVKRLNVKAPSFAQFFVTAEYTWDFMEYEEIFTNNIFQNLIIPQRALTNPIYAVFIEHPDSVTQDFFNYNTELIYNAEADEDKETISLLLNKIAINIDYIVKYVFPLFTSNSNFTDYINRQKDEWTSSSRFQTMNKDQLNSYLQGIRAVRDRLYIYRNSLQDNENLEELTNLALSLSPNSMSILPLESRMDILKDLVKNSLSTVFEHIAEEKTVIEVVQSFSYNTTTVITTFLERLAKPVFGDYKQTLYEVLLRRMSRDWNATQFAYGLLNWAFKANWKPDDTKGEFVKSIYLLWILSDYNPYTLSGTLKPNTIGVKTNILGTTWYENGDIDENGDPDLTSTKPDVKFFYTKYLGYRVEYNEDMGRNLYYQNSSDASCITLDYISKKENGIYWDNATFISRQDEILVYRTFNDKIQSTGTSNPDDWTNENTTTVTTSMYMGTYHLYQPVQLSNPGSATIFPLPTTNGEDIEAVKMNNGQNINSLIPIFLVQYVDQAGDSSDFQTCLGIAVDVVSTFVPIGNLVKLKHIRTLTGIERFRVILGAVEFTSGALSFMLNYINGCDEDGFCRRLKTFLFWLEMSTLSADAVSSRMSKNSAKEIIDNGFPSDFDNELALMQIENLAQYADTLDDISRHLDDYLEKVRKLIDTRLDKDVTGSVFDKTFYKDQFSDTDLKNLINECLVMQLTDHNMIADFVSMACRMKKKSTRSELLIQITYFKKNILKKGFPTGFSSISDYKLFCNQIKDYFDTLDDFPLDYLDLRVQGSTLKVRHPDDPIDPDSIPYLIKNGEMVSPKDIDIDILMSRDVAILYAEKAKKYWNNYVETLKKTGADNKLIKQYSSYPKSIDKCIEKGIINGFLMPPGDEFLDGLRNAQKRTNGTDIFYPKNEDNISEINASIVIKGSGYDLKPTMRFKY